MSKEIATEHIQIKLTKAEFEPYKKLMAAANIKKGTLFRKVVLGQDINIVQSKSKAQSKESERIIFLANKASNNINQIAKSLNQAYRGGVVNEQVYLKTLNNLVSIEKLFNGAIDKC